MHDVCAVVVTYNRLELLKECIASLKKQTISCDILIVNNASSDGTREYLEGENSVSCIHLDHNTGGAGGFNAGMKEAVLRGYQYIWVMDDDTMPYPDALEKLLDANKILAGNYGWLCSVPLWKDGRECVMNRPKLLKAYFLDIHFLKHGIVRAEHATFVSLFVKRETVMECGLPIKEFFIWGDDIEFTRRLSVRKKLPCYVVGQSQVLHAMKNNVGSNIAIDRPEMLKRYSLAFRNENFAFRKEGIKGVCYYIGKCGKYILLSLFKAKDHRLQRVWVIVKQMVLGLFFNPGIEYPNKD